MIFGNMKILSAIKRYLLPSLAMLIGAGFVIYGVFDGEAAAVLKKAVMICLECIGLG